MQAEGDLPPLRQAQGRSEAEGCSAAKPGDTACAREERSSLASTRNPSHQRSRACQSREVIRIGPAGWKYKEWEGVVYPKPKPRGFDELTYLSKYFDAIEINTSYYGPSRPKSARKWVESVDVNSRFKFSAKLFHSFTP